MKTVTATVVYSMSVEVEVGEDASSDEIREKILDAASKTDMGDMIVHECSEEECVD